MEARRIQQATAQEARPVYTDGAAEMSPFGAEFHALIQSLVGGGANPMLDLNLIPVAPVAAPAKARAEVVEEQPVEQEVEEEVEADVTADSEEESARPEDTVIAAEAAAAAPVKVEVVDEVAPVVEEQVVAKTDYIPKPITPEAVDAAEVQPLLVQQQQALTQEQVIRQAAPQQQLVAAQAEAQETVDSERSTLADSAPLQPQLAATPTEKPVETTKVEPKAPLSPFIAARTAEADVDPAAALADAASPQLATTEGVTESAQQSIHKSATGIAGASTSTTLAELQLRSQSALAGSSENQLQLGNSKGSAEGIALMQAQTERGAAPKGKGAATGLPRSDQEKILQQIRDVMKKATMSADGNTMVVRLDPPELGQVTVRVTQRDGQVFARVIPENPDVEQLLRQRAGEVTQALAAVGLKTDHVQLSIGRERSESETFRFQEQHGSGGGNQTGGQGSSSSGSERGSSDTVPRNKGPKSGLAADTAEVGWVA